MAVRGEAVKISTQRPIKTVIEQGKENQTVIEQGKENQTVSGIVKAYPKNVNNAPRETMAYIYGTDENTLRGETQTQSNLPSEKKSINEAIGKNLRGTGTEKSNMSNAMEAVRSEIETTLDSSELEALISLDPQSYDRVRQKIRIPKMDVSLFPKDNEEDIDAVQFLKVSNAKYLSDLNEFNTQ